MAFDVKGNLYVAASLAGRRGVVRLTPAGNADLVVSGQGIVGIAFSARRAMILASNTALYELPIGIEGVPLPIRAG